MATHSSTLVNLIAKIRSWMSWGDSQSKTTENNCNGFCHCGASALNSRIKYRCLSCGRWWCGKCVQGIASLDVAAPSRSNENTEAIFDIKTCKLCFELGPIGKSTQRCSSKVYPFASPGQSLEPSSPTFSGEKFDGHFPHSVDGITDESYSYQSSPVSFHHSSSRSDEDAGEVSAGHFFNASSEYLNDISDIDSVCPRPRHEFCSFMSLGSSPSDSPSRISINSNRVGHCVKQELEVDSSSRDDSSFDPEQAILEKSAERVWDSSNVETNGLIWIPPPPDDDADEEENSLCTHDDEDDEAGTSSGAMFSSNSSLESTLLAKEKLHLDSKEPLRVAVQGHFRALVSQLLQGPGIISTEKWLNIVAAIAWKTAYYIKPDTNGGGSMDPCDYVKVKCVASGSPSESKLIKGIVCTKNIKHKRMMSQYINTRILLLGGALEYQRVPNQLDSFDTLLQQERDHLKMIISKIEALRPNVLLVEKSVSSFAQEQLLEKEISLVINVKRPLLEQIARCTGALVTPSIDHLPKTRLGHCELFHLEKITEHHELVNQFNKKPSKTLMFFEGCPRRLGCTVVLKGSSLEELKKVKNVVQYAIFAAYHLSLETSFLADEGASFPKFSHFNPKKMTPDKEIPAPYSVVTTSYKEEIGALPRIGSEDLNLEHGLQESMSVLGVVESDDLFPNNEIIYRKALLDACDENLALDGALDNTRPTCKHAGLSPLESPSQVKMTNDAEASIENHSANDIDNSQSILVSFSSNCILNGSVCERSRLLRVKFYGPSDKPLGRYLREDLLDESSRCHSCKKSAEAHAIRYTHQHGNLMINVQRLSTVRLPREQDDKIWMWHRCLRCAHVEGVPPATRRVVMSDATWGLSFGKFLELSFLQYATGNRVANCGHSMQRDCLRFYGFGSMVASFQYSPISILSVCLPPPILEFCRPGEQSWLRQEASELLSKAEALYTEISALLQDINLRSLSSIHEFSEASDLHGRILELSDMVAKEQSYYQDLLQLPSNEIQGHNQAEVDILEINRLRHSLSVNSDVWDRRLYLLDSLLRKSSSLKVPYDVEARITRTDSETYTNPCSLDRRHEETRVEHPTIEKSFLSDKIDSAWCGADQALMGACLLDNLNSDVSETTSAAKQMNQRDNPTFRRLLSRKRVYSFDSVQRLEERMSEELPPHLHLLTLRSFHASGDFKYMVRDPVSSIQRTYSHVSPSEAEKLKISARVSPSFIPFLSILPEGARLLVQQNGQRDVFITVYDNEPTSIISYALTSKEYADWIADKPNGNAREVNAGSLFNVLNPTAADLSTCPSFGSLDLDYMQYSNYCSEDAFLSADPKSSPHCRISFEDGSSTTKMKFYVTCYFAKQFDALRKRCCPDELDFVRSLSRCRRWSAQGGKSNVYFAKSFDERFIIKQVTKTELESFNEFSSEYFKYLTDALSSGSPTCLSKVLGIYQVAAKPSRGGKETKMDLMVMENLFFKRSITKIYDLKGSARSRYNPDTTGANRVLLDMNLVENLRTDPIFLGSKAKRKLERAVWNDTSFLAWVDVMDYSLVVGVDEERKELVLGIIDYMRQYTWDKHLETWVKASGILGGPKNASPTIISPKQYKKRFRKAMTEYFLTVPDQWSS
ncbi:putative 1-phosphatidylinositol-3-phosphate 5-kinase FAB1C isoform X2 [Salvia splendens]|uniref:putative 1-phosphatidylinositol-3-phosphate 5-kinase FAB1C isoform X2 n=1 Tax=Salvia splendens TaxID=180675 RepID=UPI001C2539A3|nr:putative 1-phosphatidylinositol-3-phosphate 5-kinase FAB1C isoform X2 [Salvia splendens]